jgi:hypothetical protein
MRHLVWLLAALVLTTALAGCNSDKDRGLYRNQDKPQQAPEKDK